MGLCHENEVNPMTTILTGINGLLGSSLAANLSARGVDVVGLDVTRGETETRWRIETLDVRDSDACAR
jgi:nucleoside-diphosphate-sugar epimerase